MTALATARRYFDAWNRRAPEAIAATFAEGGTYRDPAAGELAGPEVAGYARALFAAYPDLVFEVLGAAEADPGVVAAQWLMRGTNAGPLRGLPPTGRAVALPGADFITVEGGAVRSVVGYFDQATLVKQLGLQSVVQPHAIGPFALVTSTHVASAADVVPGALTLTVLEARSDEEQHEVRERSGAIVTELMAQPGFVSFLSATVGRRMYTVTAWTDPDSPAVLGGGAHGEAMRRFFGPDFAAGGVTSVWRPHRLNDRWARCPACGQMVVAGPEAAACPCGAPPPDPPAYW